MDILSDVVLLYFPRLLGALNDVLLTIISNEMGKAFSPH